MARDRHRHGRPADAADPAGLIPLLPTRPCSTRSPRAVALHLRRMELGLVVGDVWLASRAQWSRYRLSCDLLHRIELGDGVEPASERAWEEIEILLELTDPRLSTRRST